MHSSILDFRPKLRGVVEEFGAEPNLRELVFKYYYQYFDDKDKADKLAWDYCKQVNDYEKGPR